MSEIPDDSRDPLIRAFVPTKYDFGLRTSIQTFSIDGMKAAAEGTTAELAITLAAMSISKLKYARFANERWTFMRGREINKGLKARLGPGGRR